MAARLRPPHLLPGQNPESPTHLLFESRLESWQQAVESGRGRLLSVDKLAALILSLAIVFAQVGFGVGTASASATFVVNSTTDVVDLVPGDGACDTGNTVGSDPECTLRAAVQEANALAGTDTINVPAGTYTLAITGNEDNATAGDLDVSDSVTVAGAGAGSTLIDGAAADGAFEIRGTATVTISQLTIENSGGSNFSSGVHVNAGTSATLDSIVISGGTYSPAIYNSGTLDILDSRLTGNVSTFNGGGIFTAGPTTISDTLIDDNSTNANGGGIYVGGAGGVSLTNVTLSGNSASVGGGLYNEYDIDLVNATVTLNSATQSGGLHDNGGATTTLLNTIVAGNTGGNPDANGSFDSLGYNIIETVGGSTGWIGSDRTGVDPLLQALADNGGPTPTHALTAGSEAIDNGTASGAPATDQRGVSRDGSPDIGAYEYQAAISNIVSVNSTGDAPDTSAGDNVCATGGTNSEGDPECTLRAAIQEADASAAIDAINFAIPVGDPAYASGVWTIAPSGSALDWIDATIDIDGSTQPGYAGAPVVVIDGTALSSNEIGLGFADTAADSRVAGLSIVSFPDDSISSVADRLIVEDNYLGVLPDGTTAPGSGAENIALWGAGSDSVIRDNLIAGAAAANIAVTDTVTGLVITGNKVGTDISGTVSLGGGQAFWTDTDGTVIIGGTGAGDGNTMADSMWDNIQVAGSNSTVTILGNSIHGAALLGIDLVAPGDSGTNVTANDSGDGDSGPNDLLNFPVITSATESGGTVTVTFDLDVPANPDQYRVEFFANPSGADASGYGEAEMFVSAVTTSPGMGLTHTFSGSADEVITATATRVDSGAATGFSSTSEISASFTVTGGCADSDSDGLCDLEEDANVDADDNPATNPGPDTDGDTTPNYLDADDDGDGIPTASENADPNGDGDPRDAVDSDHDGQADWLDKPITADTDGTVGSEQKISSTAGGLPAGVDDGDEFGTSVAGVGDLDGDGVDDVVVGAESDDDGGTDRGAVRILFLNADGTVKAVQKISDTQGGLSATLDNADYFGLSVAGIGDLDGDGIGDIVVGADFDDDGGTNHGAVYILFLNSDGTVKAEQKISDTQGGLTTALGDTDRFGYSVDAIGDLDGDGSNDVVVGAYGDDDGGADRGAVYVLFLNSDGRVKAEQKISDTQGGLVASLVNGDTFGSDVAGIGDINGDGIEDIAVGARYDADGGTDRGAVYILFLNSDGTVKGEQKISDTQGGLVATLSDGDKFGVSVAGLGDIDGDGVGDLVIGADGASNGRGAVHIVFLQANGTVKADQEISSVTGGLSATLDSGDQFGLSAAGLGDLDGDGVVAAIVGAISDDDGGTDRGAVYILELAAPTPPAPVVLDNIQKGTAVLGNGSSSIAATIAAVDTSKAFLTYTISGNSAVPDDLSVTGRLLNSTTVSFSRYGTTGNVNIEWAVTEFTSGVTVQRGTTTLAAPQTDIAISPVDTTTTFTTINHRSAGATYSANDYVRATLISSTNLRINVDVDYSNIVNWQVITYNDANVQRGTTNFASGTTSATATVTTVDTTKAWLLYSNTSADGTAANIGQKSFRGVITNPTTLTFDRSSSGQTAAISWELVEFTDATSVQHASTTFATSETSKDITIDPVTLNRSITIGGTTLFGGRTTYTADDNHGVNWFTTKLTTGTNVQVQRGAALATADLGWFVIHWPGATGPIVVNSTGDGADTAPGDGYCTTGGTNSAGDPECTLRAAIEEANALAGSDNIDFAVPISDPGYSVANNYWTIAPGATYEITSPVTIDATTQPGYAGSPEILLLGTSAVAGTDGFEVPGDDVTLQGFAIASFPGAGIYLTGTSDGATIEYNYIGTDITGTIAMPNTWEGIWIEGASNVIVGTLGRGNIISGNSSAGIAMDGASTVTITDNNIGTTANGLGALGNGSSGIDVQSSSAVLVVGNVISGNAGNGVVVWGSSNVQLVSNLVGTDATGNAPLSNSQDGVHIGNGSTGTVVGWLGAGNVISGNDDDGVEVVDTTGGTTIQANTIGLGLDGDTIVANGRHGVVLYNGANNTQVGGTTVGQRNVISGNVEEGVRIDGNSNPATTDNTIEGNLIGTDSTGTLDRGNGTSGVHVFAGATGTVVGGTVAAAGNTILGNGSDGVVVSDSSEATVLGNSISANGGLGIDLGDDGVTANDAGDGDTGPNNLLNFPTFTQLIAAAGSVSVSFNLDAPAGDYRIEFFSNAAADPSGYGEAATFIGFYDVVGHPGGLAAYSATVPGDIGDAIAATATEWIAAPFGATSEISAVNTAVQGILSVNSTEDGSDAVPGDGACDTGAVNSAGAPQCTLRAAIEETNALAGADNIEFGMPATEAGHTGGVWTIQPASALPPVGDYTTIDGTTQSGLIANSNVMPSGLNGTQVIVINGAAAGASDGLALNGAGDSLSGVVVQGFDGDGITIGGSDVTVGAVYVGTDATGVAAVPNTGAGIRITGDRVAIGGSAAADRLLVSGNGGNGVEITGADARIDGGVIGTNAGASGVLPNGARGVVVSSATGARIGTSGLGNIISGNNQPDSSGDGILISGGGSTTIEANLIGTNGAGAALGNYDAGIEIANATGVTVGGTGAGERNVISGNGYGIVVTGSAATGNSIVGNYIGTDMSGNVDLGNSLDGVVLSNGANNSTVGGPTSAHRNVISGNDNDGVWIVDASTNTNRVQGNWIGYAANGSIIGNLYNGVAVESGAYGNLIGGAGGGEGNRIVDSGWDGVTVGDGSGNTILGNEIVSSGDVGIDLDNDGVTANDADDLDSGSNDLLNFPVITSAVETSGTVAVGFDLDVPAGDYRIEFFTNQAANPTGYGEGETYVATYDVVGHPGGTASYTTSYAGSAGLLLTATTTAGTSTPYGSTSEFSAVVPVVSAVFIVNSTGDGGDADPGNGACDTGGTNSDGATECTLRAAIQEANALSGADEIEFDMPTTEAGHSGGVWTISPVAAYPSITEQVSIDGRTQPGWSGTPLVEVSGTLTTTTVGLDFQDVDSLLAGIAIGDYTRPITVQAARMTVVGTWIGVRADGVTLWPVNPEDALRIINGASDAVIGSPNPADRNVFVDASNAGIYFWLSHRAVIQGNFIGVLPDGITPAPNGVGINNGSGSNDLIIGGSTVGEGNVIAANSGAGIGLPGTADNARITGNSIGVDAVGGAAGNGSAGISLSSASTGVSITGNEVAYNGGDGVALSDTGALAAITGNAIYSNTGLGIDLGSDGVVVNDPGDTDTGTNGLLNYPVIDTAIGSGGVIAVDGTWDVPAGWYQIEVFSNTAADPSGFGEGASPVGTTILYHSGGGAEAWSTSVPGTVGSVVTATTTSCTDATCNSMAATSEFSAVATVLVPDTTPPVISLLGSNPQVVEVGSSYVESGATAIDDRDGDLTASVVVDASAVDTGVLGSYPVSYNVSDSSGNTAVEVTRTVNVVDTTVPVITLLGANPQVVEAGSSYMELGATASDNYDGDISASIVIDASAVDTSLVGSYPVTYNVSDSNGNAATEVTRTVQVVDTTVPVITLLGANPQVVEVGSSYVELGATASDNYDGDISASVVIDASAVNTLLVGSYVVSYSVVDSNGNPDMVFRTVNVVDTTVPVIALVGANPQVVEVGSSYVELGATAIDAGDGDLTASVVVDASAVDTGVLGSYPVSYNVSDSSGNAAVEVTRTVNVVDTTVPVILLVGADPQVIEVGSSYVELGATASDNYDSDISASIVIDASAVDTSLVGSYPVTYNVTDSEGNAAVEVTRTVQVVDTTAPVITLLGSNPQVVEVGSSYAESGATATDTGDGDISASIVIDASAVNGSVVGSYPVSYNVSDSGGNAAVEVTRTVNVVDTTVPVITLVGANPQVIEVGSSYVESGATATDTGDGDVSASIVIDASAVNGSVVGSYPVSYNVTDSEGNPATEVTRTVNVVDTTVPVITLLGSNPRVIEVGSSYVEAGATASDNYDGDISVSVVIDASAVDTSLVGSYPVSYNVTDSEGNAAVEVTRTVNVVDTTVPVIALVGANPQVIEVGSSYVELGATASDNYDGDISASIVVDASAVDTGVLGSYPVTYNVTDSEGNDAVEVTRTVNVVNAPPALSTISSQTVDEQSTLAFTATASDPDPGDTLTFSLASAPAGAAIDPSTGNFTWTPSEAQGPNVYSFDVVATDSGSPALSDSQTISVTVNEANRAPSLAAIATQSGAEQTSIVFSVPAGDLDIPGNTLTFILLGAPAGASIDPASGTISWVPSEVQGPGTYTFDVRVSDDGSPSLTDTTSVTVDVVETNQAPTVTSPGARTSAENDTISIGVWATDSDIPANGLSYTALGLPSGLSIDPVTGTIGGTIDYSAHVASPYTVTVTATDDGVPNRSGQATFTWTVADTNRPPVAADDVMNVVEDTMRTYDVRGNDTDPDGNTLTVAAVGTPAHGSTFVSGGIVTYMPDPNYNGPDSFTYTVSDGRGGAAVAAVAVTVVAVNDPPVPTPISPRTVAEQQEIGFTITASDVEGDAVAFSLNGAPAGSSITPGGSFRWTPSEAQGPGTYTFNIVATDIGSPAASAATAVTVNVTEVNSAPIVINPGNLSSREDEMVQLDISAADSDVPAGSLYYTAAGLPDGLDINPATGRISGRLSFDAAAGSPYAVGVTVGDNGLPARSSTVFFTWYVTDTNRPPVAMDVNGAADAGLLISVTLAGSDPDGDMLAYSIVDGPTKGSWFGGPRVITYKPDVTASGTDTFTFSVSDGSLSATGTVTVSITPNNVPVGGSDEYVARRGGVLSVDAPGVLDNDRDPEGEQLSVRIETSPEHGSLILSSDGSFTYEHDGGAGDLDGFAYVVDDGMRISSPISVRLVIVDNRAPIARDDVVTLNEDQETLILPLENDSDPNDERVELAGVTQPEHGSVTWTQEGMLTYRPDANFNGEDAFSYDITDGDLFDTGIVSLTIRPINDSPQASDAMVVGRSGETLTVDLTGSVADVDGDGLTYLLEAPPTGAAKQVTPGVFEINLDGIVRDLPPLAFVVTDPSGARATALLNVSVQIPAEMVGVPSLVSDSVSIGSIVGGDNGSGPGGRTSLVAGLRLMIGSVLGTFRALRMPAFILALILMASLYLGFSRRFLFASTPTTLPLGDKKHADIIMAQSQAGVPVRVEPGSHQGVMHRFAPDEDGVTTTGARAMVRSEVWAEVETPEGDGWVDAEFLTEQVPRAMFLDDARVRALVADFIDRIYGSDDLLPVTAGHDLHVALFGPPVRFSANSLRRLLLGASVHWWWGPTGDAPHTQSTFAEEVGESVAAAYRNRDAHSVEGQFPAPIEFANMHSLVVGNHELGEGWRIFFRYENGAPSIAGLMREAAPNPAAMHGQPVRQVR